MKAGGWIALASEPLTDTALAYGTGFEDLIVTRHGLRLAESGVAYAFTPKVPLPNLYIRPQVGIGVVYGFTAKANVWLDAKTLHPLCPIHPLG